MTAHRLHREIITTAVVNDMVDRSGITFAFRLNEETGASVPDITAAWLVAREVFDMPGFWSQLKELDGEVDTSAQILALLEGRKLTERATRWLLHFRRPPFDIQATIDFFAGGVLTVAAGLPKLLAGLDLTSFEERRDVFASRGFPDEPGRPDRRDGPRVLGVRHRRDRAQHRPPGRGDRRGLLRPGRPAPDHQAARPDHRPAAGRPVEHDGQGRAARRPVHRARGAGQGRADRHRGRARPSSGWPPGWPGTSRWCSRATQTLVEIWESDAFTVSTLSVAVRAIRTLVATSTLPA